MPWNHHYFTRKIHENPILDRVLRSNWITWSNTLRKRQIRLDLRCERLDASLEWGCQEKCWHRSATWRIILWLVMTNIWEIWGVLSSFSWVSMGFMGLYGFIWDIMIWVYIYIYTGYTGWCFGTCFIFPNSWDDDPIWLSYFSGGWNHQPDMIYGWLVTMIIKNQQIVD